MQPEQEEKLLTPSRRRVALCLLGVGLLVGVGMLVVPGLIGLRSDSGIPKASERDREAFGGSPDGGSARAAEFLVPDFAEDVPGGNAAKAGRSRFGRAGGRFDCIIEPNETVAIGSPVIGVIEKLEIEHGDTVEAGQVIVELESGVERAAVELARARAEMDGNVRARIANMELGWLRGERAKQLYKQNALSLDLRQQVETEAAVARLELQQAEEEKKIAALELTRAIQALERRRIRSPFDGVVVERMMAEGEVVDEDTILRVAQIDPLRVEVILPSAMFGQIEIGRRATVEPEFPEDRVYMATVKIVDKVIDAASGTFGVRLELPNPDHAIPGGLHCQVRFAGE